jgi:hypothetical protein
LSLNLRCMITARKCDITAKEGAYSATHRKNTNNPEPAMIREGVRGEDHQQSHVFSYFSPEQRVRPHHPLRAIRDMVDVVPV